MTLVRSQGVTPNSTGTGIVMVLSDSTLRPLVSCDVYLLSSVRG
jgi:hypothetical protein